MANEEKTFLLTCNHTLTTYLLWYMVQGPITNDPDSEFKVDQMN